MKRYLPPRRRRSPPPRSAQQGGGRLTLFLFLAALVLVCKFAYPGSVTALQDLILGPEGGRIQSAVSAMSDALEDGKGLGSAAEAFWQGMAQHEAS